MRTKLDGMRSWRYVTIAAPIRPTASRPRTPLRALTAEFPPGLRALLRDNAPGPSHRAHAARPRPLRRHRATQRRICRSRRWIARRAARTGSSVGRRRAGRERRLDAGTATTGSSLGRGRDRRARAGARRSTRCAASSAPRTTGTTTTTSRPSWTARESKDRRRPTLPGPCGPSTIGAVGLNGSVRNGKRCFPHAIATGNLSGRAGLQNCTTRQRTGTKK
jgi:hypothetical protein